MTKMRVCQECGGAVPDKSPEWAVFCSTKCRGVFNNRRATRGAELYDLFMALRYDREKARVLGVWTFLCKVSQLFREEDNEKRGGRKSWNDPKVVLDRKPWLRAKVMGRV